MLILIGLFYLILRFFNYFFSPIILGYDPGIYLYLFKKFATLPLTSYFSLPKWLIETHPPAIAVLGHLLTFFFSPQSILIPLAIFSVLALFYAVYKYDKNYWSLLLLSVSAVQYQLYWHFYLKNILALALLVLFLPLHKRQSRLSWVCAFLIIALHQPTALLLVPLILFQKSNLKYLLGLLIVSTTSFVISYLPAINTTFFHFLPYFVKPSDSTGDFLEFRQSLLLTIPYLPFTLAGIYQSLKKHQNQSLLILWCLTLIFSVSSIFLSRRFIPYWDLASILLAGYALKNLKFKFKTIYLGLLSILIVIYIAFNYHPLITPGEFSEIQKLSTTTPQYVLVLNSTYSPWVIGYSDKKTIAPGLGEYDTFWTPSDWQNFWSNPINRPTLIKKLPQPLTLYLGDQTSNSYLDGLESCLTRLSWNTYLINCQ